MGAEVIVLLLLRDLKEREFIDGKRGTIHPIYITLQLQIKWLQKCMRKIVYSLSKGCVGQCASKGTL